MRPQTVVERLDFVAKRIPGLKFTPPTQLRPGDDQGYGCFMSCDMYYIEIKIDQSHQSVKDVVISHGNNADGISCPVLRKVLADQDFETFAKHLTGLHSIYQINTNDKKVKQRAYPALSALEQDLTILYDHQRRRTNNCYDLVHKSPIGIMEPRKGGLPVRLTYFITPYDLVDIIQKELINLTINNIIDKNLGLSATVEIEGSSTHKLQVKSLISTQHNSSLPAYAPFNSQNSEKLPAHFVLKLCQPFPMLDTSINQIIHEINEPTTIKEYLSANIATSKESLISLIARQELDLNKGPFCRSVDTFKNTENGDTSDIKKHIYSVKLLDQHHTYHILDNYLERQEGVYITKIPFTHPTSIPIIVRVLRQQALFNFVIGSCIRRNKNTNNDKLDENSSKSTQETNIFDVIPLSLNNICVSFEHPSRKSLATLEIDSKELSCQLYALEKESVCSNEFATKVLQKCWSIPITLRSVLKKCNERKLALLEDANKRRERELQELLSSNTATTQPGLQSKSHLQIQETLLQSKFNSLHEKSNIRDLNSITEFLSSKITNDGTSDTSNQSNAGIDSASIRSNLLKKYSCKPKAKQNTATKNQPGNKILSLMLKRQNSTPALVDDENLRATHTKKAKLKSLQGDSFMKNAVFTTTKLISSEAATAARLANKQAKQGINNQNISLSLIRSPNKAPPIRLSPSSTSSHGASLSVLGPTSSSKPFDTTILISNNVNTNNIRIKSQSIGGNNNNAKPRKSSIGAVLDRLVGGVTPPEQNSSNHPSSTNDSNPESAKNPDSSKNSPPGVKLKSQIPVDRFAIKQGSLGSLKLTVTKTKPATAPSSVVNSTPTTASSSSSSSSSSLTSSTSTFVNNSLPVKPDATKILGIGSAPNIKYTIPKISKSQNNLQSSSNPTNSTDIQNSTTSDSNVQTDDSSNPSSSANQSSISSSTTNKRTTSTPFNRLNNLNRNPVSSSTHPRTTSNPLAISSRPIQRNTNENHVTNRISSCNLNQQNMRQQLTNRSVNLQLHQPVQRMINPNMISAQQQQQQLQQQQLQPQQQQQLQHLQQQQQQPPQQQQLQQLQLLQQQQQPQQLQHLQQQQLQQHLQGFQVRMNLVQPTIGAIGSMNIEEISSSTGPTTQLNVGESQGVSSSSDSGNQDLGPSISTPSSPTDFERADVVQTPPLIPIDSLDEPQPASPEADHPDDESDRLSIVDMNETAATPKSSSDNSPLNLPPL